jgi:tetratricopeptide (TPR) repeat protein
MGLFAFNLHASNKADIYNAYINNRMQDWKSAIDRIAGTPDKSDALLLELVNYQYGYIGWCLGSNNRGEAAAYLKLAEQNVKLLEAKKFELSILLAYKAAFFGYRIGLSKFSALVNGPKSADCAKLAVQLDANQPLGYIQLGNVKAHAPSLVGGSKPEAIGYYLKAKALMEQNRDEIKGDWNYLSLLAMIANCYESIDDNVKARSVYEEILSVEPQFRWIKEELYPRLLLKMNPRGKGLR